MKHLKLLFFKDSIHHLLTEDMDTREAVSRWRLEQPVSYQGRRVFILKFNCLNCPRRALVAQAYDWQALKQWVEISALSL